MKIGLAEVNMGMLAKVFLLSAWMCGQAAWANDIVIAPLVGRGLENQKVTMFTSLITSEVDFLGIYDMVDELDERPTALTSKCLNSNSCLASIAKKNHANALLTGAVSKRGKELDFFLVLNENGRNVRKKSFTIENRSDAIADKMGGYVREVITGEAPAKESILMTAAPDPRTELAMDEEMSLGDFSLSPEEEAKRAAEVAQAEEAKRFSAEVDRREAEAIAQRQAEEEARREREEARKREEIEAQRRAEIEAQRRAADQKRRSEEQQRTTDVDDMEDFDFDFAPSTAEIIAEEKENSYELNLSDSRNDSTSQEYDFGQGHSDVRKDNKTRRRTSSSTRTPKEAKGLEFDDLESLTVDQPKNESTGPRASIAAHLGGSMIQELKFVTYGMEFAYRPVRNIAVVGGAEAYTARRVIQTDEGILFFWNTILPINIGAVVEFPINNIIPYAGGELILIPGYVRDSDAVAKGLRTRGGMHILISEAFGLNLNASLGFISGENFEQVQTNLSKNGLFPQFSGGTIFMF